MPKVTIQDVQSLTDPLTSSLYELILPTIDEVIQPAGWEGSRLLRIACQTCTLPSKTITPVDLEVHAHILHFTGKVTFDGVMNVTFVETRNMSVHTYLYNWMAFIKDHNTQLGYYKATYGKNAILNVFDQNQVTVGSFQLYGFWPSMIPEITFDSTETAVTLPAQFSYDYWERIEVGNSTAHPTYNREAAG